MIIIFTSFLIDKSDRLEKKTTEAQASVNAAFTAKLFIQFSKIASLFMNSSKPKTLVMRKIFTLLVLLFATGQIVTAQTVKSEIVNWKDMVAFEAAHPELVKACKTCPKKEADDGWEGLNNANMPFPPGANIKNQNGTNAPTPGPMVPSRAPVQNFLGHIDPGNVIPPDTHGAVGLNHVITATNDFIKIHAKVGGAQISQVSISTFTAIPSTCDPYMTFDPTAQRWIFSAIQCTTNGNMMILMTSNTSDPTGTWRKITWVPSGTPNFLLDHPYVGFDNQWIVLSGRRFPSGFAGPSLFLITKADMYAGTAVTFGTNAQQIDKSAADGDSPLPVTVYDPPFSTVGNPSPGTFYVLQSWNGTSIRLTTVTGTIPAATWNTTTAVFPSGGTAWNPNGPNNSVQQAAPETRLLSANDARISCGVMMNGKIWASHHIYFPASGTPDRIAVQWWQLDGSPGATFGNVIQRGRVGGTSPNEYKWFSAIAVNKNEDVLIGYSASTNLTRPSAAYVTRQASTPLNTTDDEFIYHGGEDRYYKDFGGARARWGDYSHSSLDPVDNSLWTIQEYASTTAGPIPPDNNSRYGVWWAQVPASISTPPEVTINQAAGQADPTFISPINFTVVFDQPVTGFATGDVTLSGTAGATTGTVTGSGSVYNVAVSGMTVSGTVIATIPAGVCTNSTGGVNNASTSTDNLVNFLLVCSPVINQQPTDVNACNNSNISFTINATASGAITYQWQESTTGAGGPWNNLVNVAPYSGVTTSTLTINPAVTAMNGYQYRCIATGTCAPSATSNAAVLNIIVNSIGGTVTPANSLVCSVPNTGVLTLSGHTGSVVRWESATVLAGPYTPIANTTTTHTFNNINVTTYFRAVVQAPGCTAVTSSVATVTANISPLLIIAVPGTTLCEGDPAALSVYNTSGTNPVALTQSTSTTITSGNSVACNAGGLHTDNSYWRAYNLAAMGLPAPITINTVTFGIERASGAPQPVTVNLYTQNPGPAFPGGTRTLVGTQNFTIPAQNLTLFTGAFTTPVTVSNNAVLIVELFTPSGQGTGNGFFIGSNAAAQTGTTYLSAAACGIVDPTDIAVIGFPNMHIILNVAGTVPAPSGLATGTFLWSPAAGLSSTTTNPVAASPMNTTTYTVVNNDGAGCIRQASVTLTVNKRPTITSQPANRTNCAGSSASFTVTATGTNIIYQWQESTTGPGGPWANLANGIPYSGVNTATLTVNPVTVAMNGNQYRCVVTGTCPAVGTANISNGAILNVNALPVIDINPVGPVCGGVKGINGTLIVAGSAPPPIPGTVTVSSGAISVPVPDNSPAGATHTIAVSSVPANATITGVSVTWTLPHTWPGDMVFALKAPNGQVLNLDYLISITGAGPGTGFTNTKISSIGVNALSTGTDPYTGTFKADAIINNINAGDGGPTGYTPTATTWPPLYTTANGNWVLAMKDAFGGDNGTLTSWSITIDYTTPGATGAPLTYTWSPAAGLYTNAIATIPYIAGSQTDRVYAAPTALTTYTITGKDGVTGCTNTGSIIVNYTPPAPAITPSAVAMCLGDPAVRLTSSSAVTSTATFQSAALNLAVPDFTPNGVNTNIAVSGIPAGATVTGVRVTWNMTHTWNGDMVFVLKEPSSGRILNLDYFLSSTGGAGATTGFVNTAVGSTGTAALSSGTGTYTGLFRADAVTGVGVFGPSGPTGFDATVNSFNALISGINPNGNWTLAMYDGGPGDLGILTSWNIQITYVVGVPSTAATWSPLAGLFTDPAALNAYTGTPTDTVYARPTPSGVYPYTATVQSLSPPPAVPQTNFATGNGQALVTFNVRNNNTYAVTLTDIASAHLNAGTATVTAFYKTSAINGLPGAISAANGWTQFGTGTANIPAALTITPSLSGLNLVIPAGATYGIAFQSLTAANGANTSYSTLAAGTYTFSSGGCDIISGTNIGYGGVAAPGAPGFTPRGFIGNVSLVSSAITCTSPAKTVVVTVNQPTSIVTQPVNRTICTDKVATFTVAAGGSGPFSYQWQVSTNSGNTFANISNGGVYSGATSATLTITQPPVSMSGYFYRCVVTGAAPCASITSAQRVLTVNPLPNVVITASPYVKLYPGLVTTLSSVVTPNAAAPGGYTWLRNGAPVAGANTGTLSVDVDRLGDYTLIVTDVNGCTNASNLVSITDSVTGRCYIYPNPNSGQFQVRYYSAANNVLPRTLTVYDGKGDRVLTQMYTIGRPYDRMDVDLRKNGKGLYWVEIGDVNGNRLTMCRVVIQ